VPVLVSRDVGPIDAVKESAALFKRTWGEQIAGALGMGWAFALMGVSWTILMGLIVVAILSVNPVAAIPAGVVWVGGYLALGLVSSALSGIYAAALYRYATTGEAGLFEPALMEHAFRRK
jgi:hypothetical protein